MGNELYERYEKLRDIKGYTDYKVAKLAGIKGTATISNWKNGKYTPKDDKMQAKEEYEYIPASKYYKDGYNLYRRMEKYKNNHLLFLHDIRVPTTNNESERLLRKYKRKQKQAITFRSFEHIENLCKCMSVLVMMQKSGEPIFDKVSQIFG